MTKEDKDILNLITEIYPIENSKSPTLLAFQVVEVAKEYHKRIVKNNVALGDVVGQSEQLLALAQYICEHKNNLDGKTSKDYLQDFLSQ